MRILIAMLLCVWVIAARAQNNETAVKSERADIVIADFEGSDYGAWKTTGTAFGDGPVLERLPGQQPVRGYVGRGFASSFHGGDASTGSLTSPEFKIERKFINFRIGGGRGGDPITRTFMDLLVDGEIMRTAPAFSNRELLERESWDVSGLIGKMAQIQIVDGAGGGWAHINADQIFQSDTEDGKPVTPLPLGTEQTYQSDPRTARNVPTNRIVAVATSTQLPPHAASGAQDLRQFTVNGKIITVDVTPVNDWLLKATSTTPARRGGPATNTRNYLDPARPMKWWKICTVQEILASDSFIDHCVLSVDGGIPVRAYLKHLDPNIRDPFLPILELENQATETQSLIDADQTVLDSLVNEIGVPPNPPPTPKRQEWLARQNFQNWLAAINRMNANNVKLYGWQLFDLRGDTTDYHRCTVSFHRGLLEPTATSIKGRIKAQLVRIASAQLMEFLATKVDVADDIGGRKKNDVMDCGLRK